MHTWLTGWRLSLTILPPSFQRWCVLIKPGFQLNATHATQPCCVRCVNENRKKRKHLIGCVDDWLFRSTIPIGWRLRALRLDGCFWLRNFLAFIEFLAHFSYAIGCVACVAFSWKPGFSLETWCFVNITGYVHDLLAGVSSWWRDLTVRWSDYYQKNRSPTSTTSTSSWSTTDLRRDHAPTSLFQPISTLRVSAV